MLKMKFRTIFIIVFVLSNINVFNQNNRFLTFDLFFLQNNPNISFSQEYKFSEYLNHLKNYEINHIFIDTSISKSNSIINSKRIEELKSITTSFNINSEKISVLELPKYESQSLQSFANDIDAVKIKIAYSSETPIAYFDYKQFNLPVDKLLYEENNEESTVTSYKNKCNAFAVFNLPYKATMKVNICDYDKVNKAFTYNYYTMAELNYPTTFQKYNALGSIVGLYELSFDKEKQPNWPVKVTIPFESCFNKFEFTLIKIINQVKYNVIPIQNLYNSEEQYLSFDIKESGVYLLIHNSQRPTYDITFQTPSHLTIIEATIDERCNNIQHTADIKNNKLYFKIPATFYEPVLNIKAKDKKSGSEFYIINKPISTIEGEEKIKDIMVQDFGVYYKNERKYSLFKRYTVKTKDFQSQIKLDNL